MLITLGRLTTDAGARPAQATTGAVAADESARKFVTGIESIYLPGVPGPLCVFGPSAFTVLTARVDDSIAPLVAASGLGNGRIVAFGHDGYFGREALDHPDTRRLVTRAIRWSARHLPDDPSKGEPLRIATIRNSAPHLAPALSSEPDMRFSSLTDADLPAALDQIDVVIAPAGAIDTDLVEPLAAFIERGGAVIAGVPGWGWLSLHPGKSLADDFPANRLFARAGIVWADGDVDVPATKLLKAPFPSGDYLNASDALKRLLISHASTKPVFNDKRLAADVRTVLRAVDSIPSDDRLLRPEIEKLKTPEIPRAMPTADQPVADKDGVRKLLVALDTRAVFRAKPRDMAALFSSTTTVPSTMTAATPITREVTIDAAIPGWHSTGLYARPGDVITVTALDPAPPKASIRIGSHSDRLWHHKEWKRAPQVDRTFPLDSSSPTEAANYFGGLVYIVVPEDAPKQTARIRIEGAIEAPLFVLGKTDPKEWRDRTRKAPGPCAELASEKIIITVPSEFVRNLDDPTELMRFWDRVADACADLATIPRERKRPERYVADVQISAGYMHAGYPIMTHLDAAPRFVDLPALQRDGDWGMFHEIGHNHQNYDWTFEGTGEVTVNLFTMYVLDTVCTDRGKMHKAMSGENRAKLESKYRSAGAKFDDWKSDPFLALIMYKQLQEAFGWDAYKKVFAEYRALKPDERPKTEDEKRNQWMVRMSRTVGKNLGPFFAYWGVPTSETARKSVADLPEWMPAQAPSPSGRGSG